MHLSGDQSCTDTSTVSAAITGDRDAFATLVRRYTDVVYTLCLRMLASPADAEDAVQEIFLKAFRSLHRFDPRRRFFPWLYTIALNHLRSLLRGRASRREEELPFLEDIVPGSPDDDPAVLAIASEARDMVNRALEELTPIQHRVFLLRQLRGLSTRETAAALSLPVNTVKTHLARARRRVARIIGVKPDTAPSRI